MYVLHNTIQHMRNLWECSKGDGWGFTAFCMIFHQNEDVYVLYDSCNMSNVKMRVCL